MTQTILLIIGLFCVCAVAMGFYWSNKLYKFVTIALFALLANAIYFSLDGVKGWPAEEPGEIKGILASVVVVNPSDESAGAIYISVFPTTPPKWYEYVYPRYAPKTFFLKYTNDRAAQFEAAKQALEEGKEVRINGIPKENSGDAEGEGDSSMSGIIGKYIEKISPSQGDTYNPSVPDIEIIRPAIPQKKGNG